MKRGFIFLLIMIVSVGIIGCSKEKIEQTVLTSWDKWVKTSVESQGDDVGTPEDIAADEPVSPEATISVAVYYLKDGMLSKQMMEIPKVEGIARRTLEEMFKTPAPSGFKSAFPTGIHLNDINLKPDGTCIVDLGAEVLKLKGAAKKTAITALTRTLGQYPTIKQVKILVNGEEIPEWVGPWQVGQN